MLKTKITKLVIYRNEYQFLDSKNITFKNYHFDEIIFENTWHQPVKANRGTENVSISLSDKIRGNGEYDLNTSYFHYLYLQISNNEDKAVNIGDTYMLEVRKHGKWRCLPLNGSIGLNGSTCKVEPKGKEWTFYDISAYGELEPGRYRIALSSDENNSSYYFAEFEIDSNSKCEPIFEKTTVQQ